MSEILTPQQRALAARYEYLKTGADTHFGDLPSDKLAAWIADTEGVRLEPHQEFDVGCMCLEGSIVEVSHNRINGTATPESKANSLSLLNRAREHFDNLAVKPGIDYLIKSRATLMRGATGPYGAMMENESGVLNIQPYFKDQIAAAEILLNTYKRFKNPEHLHDLHVQTLLLLTSHFADSLDAFALPVPSRMVGEGEDNGYDFVYWLIGNDQSSGIYRGRIRSQTGGSVGGIIVVPPEELLNHEYPSQTGLGTLEALLKGIYKGVNRNTTQAKKHAEKVICKVIPVIADQLYNATPLSFEAKEDTGATEARAWLENLSPKHRFTERDRPALESCINPLETAVLGGEATPQDAFHLGWLWAEVGVLTGQPADFERAEDVLTVAATLAEENQDWAGHFDSLCSRATVVVQKAIAAGEELNSQHLATYREALADAATAALRRFGLLPAGSAQAEKLGEVLQRIEACLALATDQEGDYLGLLTSPRQRGNANAIGSDIHLHNLVDEAFSLTRFGRIKLAAQTDPNSLNFGVATVVTDSLRPAGAGRFDILLAGIQEAYGADPETTGQRQALLDRARYYLHQGSVTIGI